MSRPGDDAAGRRATKAMVFKRIVTNTLARAGVAINGDRPWDIQVLKSRFFRRAARGPLGLGESYMDRDWDVSSLDELFRRVISAGLDHSYLAQFNRLWLDLQARISNLQSRRRAKAVAEEHYDLNYRLYENFLGPFNQYTCCFFDGTEDLAEAEIKKLEIICDKLEIKSSDQVLDIGCGWGGFAKYAASTRGCQVTGVSLSREQVEYASKYTAGLPVEIVHSDYRDLPDKLDTKLDKILICGMIEHVGYKNYGNLMTVVHHLLKDQGLFLLHTIGNSEDTAIANPWIEKYIFRNSMAPSMLQLANSIRGLFTVHDWQNYGHYYSNTLSAWQENFERNWETIKSLKTTRPFDEKFRRMWNYYLLSCKAAFDVEDLQLWQIVMSKMGLRPSVYARVNLQT
ncbi:MAG: cyclopropane fatty acyl phospholipid synthase [Xanthomonadales bacterium]